MKSLRILFFAGFFSLVTQAASAKPVETVSRVDVPAYMGVWHEYAVIPFFFERKCELNTQAEYSLLPDGRISVKNSCLTKEGKLMVSNGIARSLDTVSNAKLQVTFAKIFGRWLFIPGGDYWIMDLGPNYEYALIGSPKRKYAWILTRNPQLERSTLAKLGEKLKEQGYNPCDLIISPQTGGNSHKASLCTLL